MIEPFEEIISRHYRKQEYPCLAALHHRWEQEKPLQGMKIVVATPIFRNTLTQYISLLAAGAEIILGYGGGLPFDQELLGRLRSWGFRTVCNEDDPFEVDIILDCAGIFAHWPSVYGYVELTRSGVDRYTHCSQPVFLADSGTIKQIETVLGTGESYFRAMDTLGYSIEKGKRLLIFGSGKVGSGLIAEGFRRQVEVVVVTEPHPINPRIEEMIDQVIYLQERDRIENAVQYADYIVMATGVKGAFVSVCSSDVLMRSAAICANMGVEDEYGQTIPEERIIEGKRAVNFILEEPTHLKYIDATLALHAYGAISILQQTLKNGLNLPPVEVERELIEITLRDGIIGQELLRSGLV